MSEPPPLSPPVPGSTQAAGQSADESQGRTFPCDQCGADLTFSIGQQTLTCPFCGYVKQLEPPPDEPLAEQDLEAMLARVTEMREKQAGAGEGPGTHEIRCSACGGTVAFLGTLTSTECPYCGSPIQRENVHDSPQRVPVNGVLPFSIPRETAAENLRKWVKSRWFAPNEFLKRGVEGKFNGIYFPYWTFDALTYNRWRGQRGEHYYVTVGQGKEQRQEQRTRWYPVSGQFEQVFDDVLSFASIGLPRWMTIELEPWPLQKCVPFKQDYLAGFLARTYDVELDQGLVDAKQRMTEAIQAAVVKRIGGDEQRVDSVLTQYSALSYKHLLLPLWLMAYRYQEKAYQVAVNAATGEVQGERPYSWVKITLAILTGVLAVGTFFYLRRNS